MNRAFMILFIFATIWLAVANCYARSIANPAIVMETPARQAAGLAATEMRPGLSASELHEMFRLKYGRRGEMLLGDEGEDFLTIPGVADNAGRAANMNSANFAKGYLRNHLYARQIYNDPDFELLGADRPIETASGKTDMDLIFRQIFTEREFRMEVKNVKEENLLRNIEKYETQIDKMAEDAEVSGREQIWVNRRSVPPELRDYAEARGVRVFENVVTGEKSRLRPGTTTMSEVLEKMKTEESAGDGLGLGGVRNQQLADSEDLAGGVRWYGGATRVGEAELTADLEGGIEGDLEGGLDGGLIGTAIATTKVLGIAGVAVAVGFEGYDIYKWYNGHLSTRRLIGSSASLGGGLAGGLGGGFAGAAAGGAIGSVVPIIGTAAGGIIGGIIGGVTGGFAGSEAAG
jgi:hypothetical protein